MKYEQDYEPDFHGKSGRYISVPRLLANVTLAYVMASVYYIFMTYSNDENRQLYEKNKKHFYVGVILSSICIYYFEPLKSF